MMAHTGEWVESSSDKRFILMQNIINYSIYNTILENKCKKRCENNLLYFTTLTKNNEILCFGYYQIRNIRNTEQLKKKHNKISIYKTQK